MPTNLPSSFASAAAGQNANRDSRGGRSDGRSVAGGDWSRRDGRSANGTMTFRRASTTPLGVGSQPPPPIETPTSPVATDSAAAASSYDLSSTRYSRDDLLDMFGPGKPRVNLDSLFIPGWDPSLINGNTGRGWGKSNENHVPQEPGACWDPNGETTPMGLQSLSAEEKEAFATDINSPLKPPTQNKDGHQTNVNGRKSSLSQGSGNAFGITSPTTTTRPGTRRRETQDSNPFGAGGLGSPTATNRFGRDDQASWLPKKPSDLREGEADDPTADSSSGRPGLGNLMRSNTAGSAGLGSMWPSSNPTTPSAGGFGSFSMSSATAIGDKRGAAGGSRLAHLMPREGSDSAALKTAEVQSPGNQQSWRSRPRTDTDPFGEDELSGSAVLGGSQDVGSGGARAGLLGTPVKGSTDDFGMSGLHLNDDKDQNSPSGTNPYRSPPAERREQDDDELGGAEKSHGQSDQAGFGAFGRGFGGPPFDAGDRSQTSSVGAKGYPMGSLSGWPAPGPSTNTPDRERGNFGGAFGSSLFGGMGDLQSPGLSNLGNVFGPSAAGSIGRGSKLGSLFPAAMQAQMQSHDPDAQASEGGADMRQNNPLGAIGRGAFGMPPRDTESPMRSNRGVFEDLFPSSDAARGHGAFPGADGQQVGAGTVPQSFTPVSGGLPFGAQPSGEPPSAQVRQMVMPDRMRWVYLDPQGQVQGPFTGLEMNDWYKANFFTPDLRVKKVEDTEFEPLGQLIRRIGNSREPFLVPQIGVPHGPPSQTGPFNNTAGVVPPLSGVFPSFGRTLTAEEQNNLERRKQEEQYLAAQQREYMMRQGPLPKFPIAGGQNLQHHSSAQSLQSQPSFGSMSGPMGMPQQQPSIGSMQSGGGFNDPASGMHPGARPGAGSGDMFRQEDLSNLTSTERELLASMDGADKQQQQPIGASADQAGRSDLPDTTDLEEDEEGFKGRLQQFEDLRSQHDAAQATVADNTAAAVESLHAEAKAEKSSKKTPRGEDSSLSLTEQVQIAQAAAAAQPGEPGLPMPFPPPSSQTPLPAPTAQRVRSNLPEQYSRSQSATPEVVQPPPLAPWAKEAGNGPKGPSLKEIQEAEARKAAKAEEVADALRKAAAAQEHALARERERAASAAANAAALPASSTWGHGSPSATTTPWSKPGSVKPSTSGLSTSSSNSKKTLADIQREEEARKQKARDVSAQTGVPAPATKSYANLAGKPSYASPMASPSAASSVVAAQPPPPGWSMVGAGGKVKTPGATGVQSRSTSISSAKPSPIVTAAKPSPKPIVAAIQTRSDGASTAVDEFNKWVNRELSKGITGVTDIAAFQNDLASFPLETGIIADAVYSQSTTMDGRHFAEEYVRRKRLAEKGIIEKQTAADRSASGGWNEVAKKGGNPAVPREADNSTAMQAAGFKVVPSRKKGKK